VEPYRERAEFGLIDAAGKTEVIFGHLRFTGNISGRIGETSGAKV
jgi:hypothetical protein